MNGRKRHILVATVGLLLTVIVQAADLQDRAGATLVLTDLEGWLPRLRLLWTDGGYAGKLGAWVQQPSGWMLTVIKRTDHEPGLAVLPKRWIVERTFGWLNRYRVVTPIRSDGGVSWSAEVR